MDSTFLFSKRGDLFISFSDRRFAAQFAFRKSVAIFSARFFARARLKAKLPAMVFLTEPFLGHTHRLTHTTSQVVKLFSVTMLFSWILI